MKRRYILYRRKRGGMFYIEDTETRKQESTEIGVPCFNVKTSVLIPWSLRQALSVSAQAMKSG